MVEHVSQTRRSSGSAGLSKLRRRLPTENIYGVVTGAPSVMPTWFGTLKQCQSRVMVLIELGEISTWVLMLVTKYRRPRGDEKAAILELTDDSGIKHPDTIELPDATIRQYSSAGDLVRANEELKSAGPEDEEEDEEDEEDGEEPALARAGAAEEEEEGHDPARTLAMDDAAVDADDGDGGGGGGTGFAAEPPRTKKMRIVDDTANWADAVRAQAEYVTSKAQFSLADLQDSRELPPGETPRSFAEPSSQPGPTLIASFHDPVDGIGAIQDVMHMTANIFNWSEAVNRVRILRQPGAPICWNLARRCFEDCRRCAGEPHHPVAKMNMDEYVESGLNAHGILEDMTVRVELVEAAHRGYLNSGDALSALDSALETARQAVAPMQRESVIGQSFELTPAVHL